MALATALMLTATQAAAQAWTTNTSVGGTYLFGSAYDPGGSLGFGCTAPSPQGRPAIETESHEEHVTGPFEVLVRFRDSLFDWNRPGVANFTLTGVVIYVNDTGYGLPPVALDELSGTVVRLSMTDPMIAALYDANRLVLDTGQGTAFEYSVAGLSNALQDAMSYCARRWVDLGQPLPAALSRFALPGAEGEGTNTDTATSPNLPAIAQGHVNRMCEGSGTAGPNGLAYGDIDGDGADDILVDWSDVTCPGNRARYFCGASLCSGDVLLSRNNYVMREGDVLLGMSHSLVPLSNGNMGVSSSGNLSICQSTQGCAFVTYWDGAKLDTIK